MRSYTVGPIKFQSFVAPLAVLAAMLGGCSQMSVPIGSNNVDTPTILTGSIASPTDIAYSDISAEDRGIIAANLDTLRIDADPERPLDGLSLPWLNSVSGNSGTLSAIDADMMASTGCLNFRTTANTIAGIKLYKGTACRDITSRFAVTSLTVADA